MAHYALLNENNIVIEVLTGVDENISKIDIDGTEIGGSTEAWETYYGNMFNSVCKRTSRNTNGGVHLEGGTPFRYNYAGIGYTWDGIGFAAPQPYSSWSLNQETYLWEAPAPMPTDSKVYRWDEDTTSWVEVITE